MIFVVIFVFVPDGILFALYDRWIRTLFWVLLFWLVSLNFFLFTSVNDLN